MDQIITLVESEKSTQITFIVLGVISLLLALFSGIYFGRKWVKGEESYASNTLFSIIIGVFIFFTCFKVAAFIKSETDELRFIASKAIEKELIVDEWKHLTSNLVHNKYKFSTENKNYTLSSFSEMNLKGEILTGFYISDTLQGVMFRDSFFPVEKI